MGTAARLRALRIRAGLSRVEMAQLLGLNDAWVADLETRDGELASTLSLFKALELAALLGVPLHELVNEPPVAGKRISLLDLPDLIRARAGRENISIEQLQARLNLDLRAVLSSPIQSASDFPIGFFRALAHELGINWLTLVPDEHTD